MGAHARLLGHEETDSGPLSSFFFSGGSPVGHRPFIFAAELMPGKMPGEYFRKDNHLTAGSLVFPCRSWCSPARAARLIRPPSPSVTLMLVAECGSLIGTSAASPGTPRGTRIAAYSLGFFPPIHTNSNSSSLLYLRFHWSTKTILPFQFLPFSPSTGVTIIHI